MAIDFPNSPSNGETYSYGNNTWSWNGSYWETVVSVGTSGTSGSSGSSGAAGASGSSGTSGAAGTSGSSGTSGANGSSGTSGTAGANGSSGSSGISFLFVTSTSSTSLTLDLTHAGAYLRTTSATAVDITVPPTSSVNWATDTEILFEQAGAGQVTFLTGSGVVINSSETLKTQKQYSVVGIKYTSSDIWTLIGERELV